MTMKMTRREAIAAISTAALALVAGTNPLIGKTADRKFSSNKKGLGLTVSHPKYPRKLTKLNNAWFYNWGVNAKGRPAEIEYIPMVWGPSSNPAERAKKLAERARANEIDTLLGFNEPDGRKQANMSVEEALKEWPDLMATGLRLGSPGCVHADVLWMQEFMEKARQRDYRVDFICVHRYGGASPQAFINHLEKIRKLYGLPIWITEFAVADWKAKNLAENRHDPNQVHRFVREVIPELERIDWIERYAWFPADPKHRALGHSALWDADGNLTQVGELYASL